MKESISILPISRSESSGSADSTYSFDQDTGSTSPPPSMSGTVSLETSSGFQDLLQKPKLTPKAHRDRDGGNQAAWKNFLWKLYMTFPFLIITIFGILIIVENYNHQITNATDGLYRPNLPSSFESATGTYDNLDIEFYDLNDYKESANGWQHHERVLFCVPLRDASQHLPMFFNHMRNLTYPHNLVDLAFLISDTTDSTIKDLKKFLKEIQTDPNLDNRFGRINIYEKDFGQVVGQTFSDRHGFALQGPRRKLMAIARNWLLSTLLRPDHSWVYWRDIDVETCPGTIIEDLMHHNKDVIVPNVWRPLPDWLDYEQPYDLNSWQESEGGLELLDKLDDDAVIVEGYSEYATWRPHLAYLRDPNGDPEVEMELDGIGGVSILAKASVFKSGAHFPAFSFQKHAETEAFGKLCKYMGFSVIGLPHYTIWHIYEPSSDDLKHMEWMAKEEQTRFEKLKLQKIYDRTWKLAFDDVSKDWDNLKFNVFKNTDLTKFRSVEVDWNEVDEYLQDINDQTINYEHFIDEKQEDVRNYDANDPAKFIYNKYSHKKSEIDLKFKLNEYDKQKNFVKSDDVNNYGINKGEILFGSFPINPYLSGNNPKSMRFVKFKKNELIKFDELESSSSTTKENDQVTEEQIVKEANLVGEEQDVKDLPDAQDLPNDDISIDSKNLKDLELSKDLSDLKDAVVEDDNQLKEAIVKDKTPISKDKQLNELKLDTLNQDSQELSIEVKPDQLEPSKEDQLLKSKENIRQDAMAAVVLKQKLAKQEIENINKKEKLDSIQQSSLPKIDPVGIKVDNEKKLKQKVIEKQQEINALAAIKKKEESDQNVNLNKKLETDEKAKELKLAKLEEEIELNSIANAKVLQKVKNYQNEKLNLNKINNNKESFSDKSKLKDDDTADSNLNAASDSDSESQPQQLKRISNDVAKGGKHSVPKENIKLTKDLEDDDEDDEDDSKDDGGLLDNINIGGSKEKLEKPKDEIDDIILPKKEKKTPPILE